jgi:hypothetical protein
MSDNKLPKTPAAEPEKVGYCKPPKHTQFKKGQSGNPKGRPKAQQQFKTVNRIVQDVLFMEVKGMVGGKRQTMLGLEAVVAKQMAKALEGDTPAAKLVLDRADKHVATRQTLADLLGGRPKFTFTEEEAARFSRDKLLEGVVFDDEHDDSPSKGNDDSPKDDDDEGQPL